MESEANWSSLFSNRLNHMLGKLTETTHNRTIKSQIKGLIYTVLVQFEVLRSCCKNLSILFEHFYDIWLIQKVLHWHLWSWYWNSCQRIHNIWIGKNFNIRTKTIEISKVNRKNLIKCIRKNCPMLGINWNGAYLAPNFKKCYGVLDLWSDCKQ